MPRDFTQYLFNGREYGKGKLVLAVIREHVSKNTTITFDRLVNASGIFFSLDSNKKTIIWGKGFF
jgi:hypothetical protein